MEHITGNLSYSPFTLLEEDVKRKETERVELSKKCFDYKDKFIKQNNYRQLTSDYLNGCTYYLTPSKEIVKISCVFSKVYPPIFESVNGDEKQHIIDLNVKEGLF